MRTDRTLVYFLRLYLVYELTFVVAELVARHSAIGSQSIPDDGLDRIIGAQILGGTIP